MELIVREETMQKVHRALVNVGLSESDIIDAINEMQNNGIYFREANTNGANTEATSRP